MSNIPGDREYIQIEPTQTRFPVSESLMQTIGGTINYILDELVVDEARITALENRHANLVAVAVTNGFTAAGNLSYTTAATLTLNKLAIGSYVKLYCVPTAGTSSPTINSTTATKISALNGIDGAVVNVFVGSTSMGFVFLQNALGATNVLHSPGEVLILDMINTAVTGNITYILAATNSNWLNITFVAEEVLS